MLSAEEIAKKIYYITEDRLYYDIDHLRRPMKKRVLIDCYGSEVCSLIRKNPQVKRRIRYLPNYTPTKDELNIYRDQRIPSVPGDHEWFLKLLDAHFTTKDREIVERFLVSVVCSPEERLDYGVLITGPREGTGKTSLFHIIEGIMGRDNSRIDSVYWNCLASPFNCHFEHKDFICFEINSLEKKDRYTKHIFPYIKNDTINIRGKFRPEIPRDNIAKVMLISNYRQPLNNTDALVVVNARSDAKAPIPYKEFEHHMKNSLGAVRAYLESIKK